MAVVYNPFKGRYPLEPVKWYCVAYSSRAVGAWGAKSARSNLPKLGVKMHLTKTVFAGTLLAAAVALSTGTAGAAGNGIVASASAGYQVTFNDQLRTVEFVAQRDSGNNSRGQGHLFNHNTGIDLHFVVDCLSVAGNVATISGTVSNTDPALGLPVGTPFWVQVIDQGEGKKSPPDLVSPLFLIPGGPPVNCTTPLVNATLPIAGGNVQVH